MIMLNKALSFFFIMCLASTSHSMAMMAGDDDYSNTPPRSRQTGSGDQDDRKTEWQQNRARQDQLHRELSWMHDRHDLEVRERKIQFEREQEDLKNRYELEKKRTAAQEEASDRELDELKRLHTAEVASLKQTLNKDLLLLQQDHNAATQRKIAETWAQKKEEEKPAQPIMYYDSDAEEFASAWLNTSVQKLEEHLKDPDL